MADVQERLATQERIRTNAILAVSNLLSASRDWFEAASPAQVEAWRDRSMEWLRETYGAANVVAAVLHRDETTLHIQAMVVPIDERGKLTASHWLDGPAKMSALQDSYARAVEDLGLTRGVQGSKATHQELQEWYGKVQQPTPAPEIVKRDIEIERPGRLTRDLDRWVMEQREKVVERIAPALDAALTKATHYEEQAATAEANIVVLQQRVRELERDYKTLATQVRGLDLRAVIERLGGERDRYDKHKWRLDGEHISVNGEKFYNHDRREGGGGAIDLVQHIIPGADFKQAVAFLSDEVGRELALSAAARYGARQAQQEAEEVIARLGRGERERGAFVAPAPDADRWPQVRAYLIEQRGIPRGMVNTLHERGDIYADARSNAVFVRRDAGREIVGASLHGTLPGSEFQGLAQGSRRDEGHFSFALTLGKPDDPHDTPQYHLVESPIDALSRAALVRQAGETGRHAFISIDGQGELPRRQIDEALANRGLVRCGFDNDQGGNKLWAQVKEAYPRAEAIERERPPAGTKDWNDALRAAQERAQVQAQEQARTPAHGRAPARGTDYHDR